ncbi:hypothetical protein SlsnVgp016 [Spodoptera littoralis nucleopolyhedrovirus]|uniref:ORF1 n=2 Tax=Alphabaculovirus TaxID=558016 RepID=D5K677_NPVST|nr:hypothetical protein SlsnVgp016 [Spodoptera littoralis nucleopolyhedrovirus]ADE80898.1 ORF1 [Spodoptera litura nucleopolyhedrovirus]ADE80904.1 ORF1 [Spodoptera litura nucleopolyhedrovirus]ADE80915.1 ORF1 [Spodoptera litura nucleopolyhedrovirus]AGE89871.1 hypothetical protein SlsnVgp016 [Spodoptera littoralis nucleopolyhedrovirus]AYU75209.1 hypothetical protein [Spodoptera littoralis nucleopolyhedrovirus]
MEFDKDIARLTAAIGQNVDVQSASPSPKLGDVLQQLGRKRNGLLSRKKDENFDIAETIELSDATKDYLNVLQLEKLYACRACYERDDSRRCWFHKKYIFTKNMKTHYDEYVQFLNSQMGIVSYVELYYTYLAAPPFWNATAKIMLDELTGHSSIASLLKHHGHETSIDADEPAAVAMDTCEEK